MLTRRKFISAMSKGGLMIGINQFPIGMFDRGEVTKLTILHTNDVHSRIDPFPMDGGRNEGKGGLSARNKLIERIRGEEDHVLLLDSGDIFQGTPYFNFYGGEIEMKGMTMLKYDAGTMGNHDFDAGIEGFVKQVIHADFPFVMSNYEVGDTALSSILKDYIIKEIGALKIGIFGLGIQLDGLVPEKLCKGVVYQDPIKQGQRVASHLKGELGCDLVICLSHLGFSFGERKIGDEELASQTRDIDVILGGHSHVFMKQMMRYQNSDGDAVFINQAGFGGLMLGRIDLYFENNNKTKCQTCNNLLVN